MSKQVFKGTVLTKTKVVNNIFRVFNDQRIVVKGNWYIEANEFCNELATKYKVDKLQVAGITAAFSPLKSWDENKKLVIEFLKTGTAKHTGRMIGKAEDIINYNGSEQRDFILVTLNGNKIKRFFLNIAYPNVADAVTVDRHAICIALGKVVPEYMLKDVTDRQYAFFEDCYVKAASKVGIMPHEIQAVTWVKWRQLKKLESNAEVPF